MKLLVTGGAGFIGSHYIDHILAKYPDYQVINYDLITYAGVLENIKMHEKTPRYFFIKGDVCDREAVDAIFEQGIDAVIHFAAETHVDRSIEDSHPFVMTNVLGTQVLLEASRNHRISKFIYISTDEVYGSLGEVGLFTEEAILAPRNPYSASKAGADFLAKAYFETYGLPICITRCSNNYGPRQNSEKLIPRMILNAVSNKELPIYGDGLNIRDWIYVEDHCRAIDLVLHGGRPGEVYNIGSHCEKTNLEVVKTILDETGKSRSLLRFIKDRPGHDRRYGLDASKIRNELGWRPIIPFEEGIRMTIKWFQS